MYIFRRLVGRLISVSLSLLRSLSDFYYHKTDGIVQQDEWFTQPHVEIGGNDTVYQKFYLLKKGL